MPLDDSQVRTGRACRMAPVEAEHQMLSLDWTFCPVLRPFVFDRPWAREGAHRTVTAARIPAVAAAESACGLCAVRLASCMLPVSLALSRLTQLLWLWAVASALMHCDRTEVK